MAMLRMSLAEPVDRMTADVAAPLTMMVLWLMRQRGGAQGLDAVVVGVGGVDQVVDVGVLEDDVGLGFDAVDGAVDVAAQAGEAAAVDG